MRVNVLFDRNGRVGGFPHHDGKLVGVMIQGAGSKIDLFINAQSGEQYVLSLRGIRALCIDNFREGNIILDIFFLPSQPPPSFPGALRLIQERLFLEPGTLSAETKIFLLEASYGAEVIAVCEALEVAVLVDQ